jgi:imidazolonepropionase-like amidohydrolase
VLHSVRCLIFLSLAAYLVESLVAQSTTAARPILGLRDNAPQKFALTHAEVVVEPGQSIADATVLVEGSSITAMGVAVEIPPGFMSIDLTGKRIYAGLIDAWSEAKVPHTDLAAGHWNENVTPQRQAATIATQELADATKLRSQGFTVRVVAPEGGIIKGGSCVVLVSDAEDGRRLLKESAWQHLSLTVPREFKAAYPNSPMGAVALLRQSFHDANWYRDAWDAYLASPELQRPETNVALDSLAKSMVSASFVIDAPNERMAIRADKMAREFSLPLILRGSGREYRAIEPLVAINRPVLLPLNFPETPQVKTLESAEKVTLQDLMHWDLAPENPGRLSTAGVSICLTTDGLADIGDFLKRVRQAVKRGLHPDAALAAVTTTPARLLSMDDHVGQVRPGMLANFFITDGDWLAEKTKVLECWVAGKQFVVSPAANPALDQLVGKWSVTARVDQADVTMQLELQREEDSLTGKLGWPLPEKVETNEPAADPATETQEVDSEADSEKDNETDTETDSKPELVELKDLVQERDRMTATVDLHAVDESLPQGVSRLSWVTIAGEDGRPKIQASITLPDGRTLPLNVNFIEPVAAAEEQKEEAAEENLVNQPTPILYPLGAYGRTEPISKPTTVLFRGATVWTCDQAGKLATADVLIQDGLIAAIGANLTPPDGCEVVDASGKHLTPGLIDCHSHMATDGGVNESGQAVTADVRIGDFIDNSDISIYRQLAGGLTIANVLHGSANPIGGQNQVIKLRWGASMDALRMSEAPAGIKFALGENVKRNQSRYPNTRMGVEQIIRDQLIAAREYQAKWQTWRQGNRDSLPPRIDLQLEALAEVQRGERWIHCHSYRQDEIVATLDVLEEFGIQIGTLQHILEGYKVADRMAAHGAMGSSFADWWAYKFEVFDAIPYNGALMHDRGVVVSFNSDDGELARHLNTEAAKATKYGGVPEEEALKFVTLNPAKQLRIDQYVGSITVGKQADLVLWSGRPLSTLSRCEQTWIDGKKYFDVQTDQTLRERDAALRATLIQKALADKQPEKKQEKSEVPEEERWFRHDVYCTAHGGLRTGHEGSQR